MAQVVRTDLTAEFVRSVLNYDRSTGVFTWLPRLDRPKHQMTFAGKVAGARGSDGYVRIYVAGRKYGAHTLAWLYEHGCWPEYNLDHINRDPSDNRIENLREATPALQLANTRTRNALGVRGVYLKNNRYCAGITINGNYKHLGTFTTAQDAVAAYDAAAREAWGDFAAPQQVPADMPDCWVKFRWGDGIKPKKPSGVRRGRKVGMKLSEAARAKIGAGVREAALRRRLLRDFA
jgi:hypothetical protein